MMNDINIYSFYKEEKVYGDKRVETLFARGKSFVAYPLRVVYNETNYPTSFSLSILITVPKKRIKSAVKRNKIKRRISEAYRLNKHIINDVRNKDGRRFDIGFVYVKDEVADFATIEKGVIKALIGLKNKLFFIEKNNEND